MSRYDWIGVDLDGTMAMVCPGMPYDPRVVGAPIVPVVERVKRVLAEGRNVKVLTARVYPGEKGTVTVRAIEEWCKEHVGQVLPVTCSKDAFMVELWDDRAKQVIPNRGVFLEDLLSGKAELSEC